MALEPDTLRRIGHAINGLWLVFKLGLVLSVGFLVVGTVVAGLLYPTRWEHMVPPRISAIAEIGMAIACLALVIENVLEGYVYVRSGARPLQMQVRGLLGNILTVLLLVAGIGVLSVQAVRDWLQAG